MRNSSKILQQGSLTFICFSILLNSCQMGDYAEKEIANQHYYSKEDSLKTPEHRQIDSTKEAEKTKEVMFTTP